MFCPNCGTQNPDAAATCSKCNFHLKGAAAPKFKGTMLMMNQQAIPGAPPGVGAGGGVPAPPGAPAGAPAAPTTASVPGAPPRPAGAHSAVPSKLKGTMVGVAPMSMGGGGPSPAGAPPQGMMGAPQYAPPAGGSNPPHAAMPAAPGYDPSGYGAPAHAPPPQQGVNPLGGTVAADAGGFAAFAQQAAAATPNPYGAPPAQGPPGYGAPYGAPPPGAAPYGAPPNAYGAPPQAGPGGYGAPLQQQQNYNPMSPQGGMPYGGAMPNALGMPNAMQGTLPSQGVAPGPTRRNALMVFLLPLAVMFGGTVFATILAILTSSPALGSLSGLFVLGGSVWFIVLAIQMANEVKAVTGNAAFAWWPLFVPFYNYYWLLILVPQEVTKAKQIRGVQAPTRNIVLYLFLWHFALASDLNDLVR